MHLGPYRLAANVSLLFAEADFLHRFELARAAGFTAAECWWPFATAAPARSELDAFLSAVDRSGLDLVAVNFFAGDMAAGERGVLSHPGRQPEFLDSLAVISSIADETGCRMFNAVYGQRVEGVGPARQDAVAMENLAVAQAELAPQAATILLEALTVGENGDYPLTSCAQVADVIAVGAVGPSSVDLKILFDAYHLTNNGENLPESIRRFAGQIGHVQLADSPGRGSPGTGTIDFPGVIECLSETGYSGVIAAEYRPAGATADGLGWIADLNEQLDNAGR
jgi:hydroxypyruvate isomerase